MFDLSKGSAIALVSINAARNGGGYQGVGCDHAACRWLSIVLGCQELSNAARHGGGYQGVGCDHAAGRWLTIVLGGMLRRLNAFVQAISTRHGSIAVWQKCCRMAAFIAN